MDLGSTTTVETKGNTFVSHVFNFDEDTKDTLLNVSQYTALSVVPVVLLNKAVQRVFPEPDEDKSNLEILAEIVGQLVFMLVAVFFIHRLVTFVPTYSGAEYKELNLFTVVLVFLVLMLSVQTRAGQKVNILMDRLIDYYEGKPPAQVQPQVQAQVQAQPQQLMPPPPPQSTSQRPQFDAMYERAVPDAMPTPPTFASEPQIEAFGGSTGGGLGYSFL